MQLRKPISVRTPVMSALKLDGLLWLPECVELDTDRLCHSRAKLGHGLLSGEYSKPASAEGEQQPDQKVRFEYSSHMVYVKWGRRRENRF